MAVLLVALLLYLILAVLSSATKVPSNDEGSFANQAWTLWSQGRMAVPIKVDPIRPHGGLAERAYWIAPLHPMLLAGWFGVFGFGLMTMRMLSALWGAVGLIAFFFFLDRLTMRRPLALTGVWILALTYTFVDSASYGRMDIMCMALGLSGWAVYLSLRHNLDRAVLVSQMLIAASGLTHWSGLWWALGAIMIAWVLDRDRLQWRHLGLAAIPFVIGGALWGIFILRDPAEFTRQFLGNAGAAGRMSGIFKPWLGFMREFTERYATSYGLGKHSPGQTGPVFLKAFTLAVSCVSLAACVLWKPLQRQPACRLILGLFVLFFGLDSWLEGQKLSLYLVHMIPLFSAMLAMFALAVWERRRWAVAIVAVPLLIDTAGLLYRSWQNPYAKSYQPLHDVLLRSVRPESIVYGHHDVYFAMSAGSRYWDDPYLGFSTGQPPDFFIMDDTWRASQEDIREKDPVAWTYIQGIFAQSQPIYENPVFRLYARKTSP